MANADDKQQGSDREREGLDEFADRFGDLKDRMEQEVHPDLDRQDLPTAEHPDSIQAREEAAAEAAQEPEHEVWPDEQVKPDFERAVANEGAPEARQGVDSQQVGRDSPDHNLPPPRDGEDADRAAHTERMGQDDHLSRVTMTDQYYDRLVERMQDAELDQTANAQDRDQGQDYEHSR